MSSSSLEMDTHSLFADWTAGGSKRLIRMGNAAAAAMVLGLGAWVTLAPLSGAAIAPGAVKVDLDRRTVNHQEGGIVREVKVRDGDRVQAGQPLLVLEDVRVDASQELLRTQLGSELAKAARLDAERSGATDIAFPPELTARATDARVAELLAKERGLFDARRAALREQLQLIDAQSRDIGEEIAARERQVDSDTRSLALVREDVQTAERLVAEKFVSRSRLLGLQRNEADYDSRRNQNHAELAQSRQRLTELRLRAANLRNERMREAAQEHKQSVATIFDLREKLRPWQDAGERQVIRAPVAGEVMGLRVSAAGSVIGARDPILDIVPQDAELVVEARMRPEDINAVRRGAPADVRLTSYKGRVTPVVPGTVAYVSADRFDDAATRISYYTVHVHMTKDALQRAGIERLQAGMPAEVHVRTGERTALAYFLEPVTGFFGRAMREP